MSKSLLCLVAMSLWGTLAWALPAHKTSFAITVKGETTDYTLFSVFVLPGETIPVSSTIAFTPTSATVATRKVGATAWELVGPARSGAYTVAIAAGTGESMTLNVLVLTPLSEMSGEYLKGYRIGKYPSNPLRGDPIYLPPKGLFEVTTTNQNLKLTPHFTLKQFLCKQGGGYPKFVLVRERLLLKLEYLLEVAQLEGYTIETFGFISGYRTPFYNHSIGNVQYSRHVWGGAADIIIDQNGDGNMDDLNKDGVVDEKDVRVFYDLVEAQYQKGEPYRPFIGGLGFYRRNSRHHGFIHVDVRGTKARW